MTQHALYRVVQESLTNVHKHAPGAAVTVTLRYEPGTLVAEVRNPHSATGTARASGAPGGGQGIIGLRERVRVIGGLLRAGADGTDYRGDYQGRRGPLAYPEDAWDIVLRGASPNRAEPGSVFGVSLTTLTLVV